LSPSSSKTIVTHHTIIIIVSKLLTTNTIVVEQNNFFKQMCRRPIHYTVHCAHQWRPCFVSKYNNNRCRWQICRIFQCFTCSRSRIRYTSIQ
jgi:hypothetical protein